MGTLQRLFRRLPCKEVIKSDSVLRGIYVDNKYCQFTERLKDTARGVYLEKMGEAVKALKPEKKSLARLYARLGNMFLWRAWAGKANTLSVKQEMEIMGIKV